MARCCTVCGLTRHCCPQERRRPFRCGLNVQHSTVAKASDWTGEHAGGYAINADTPPTPESAYPQRKAHRTTTVMYTVFLPVQNSGKTNPVLAASLHDTCQLHTLDMFMPMPAWSGRLDRLSSFIDSVSIVPCPAADGVSRSTYGSNRDWTRRVGRRTDDATRRSTALPIVHRPPLAREIGVSPRGLPYQSTWPTIDRRALCTALGNGQHRLAV